LARKTIAFVDIFGGSWILLIRFDYELRSEHRQRMVRRQDISALLLYCLGYSRIRNLIFRLQLKPVTRMVIFHNIFSEASSNFKANLFFLKQRTNVVGLDEYFSGRLSFNKVNVVITFDDGYKSWLTHAIPALKELGLSATFFVTSGSVGLSKEKEADFMQSNLRLRPDARTISEGLSVSDVKKIVKEGFTLGGHTLNHGHLGEIGDSSLIRAEIIEDKSSLEKMGGIKIEYFAYPF
jgi:peptidoglycan/xylan/chitin deacetylase (PgdA/CDA1 family)